MTNKSTRKAWISLQNLIFGYSQSRNRTSPKVAEPLNKLRVLVVSEKPDLLAATNGDLPGQAARMKNELQLESLEYVMGTQSFCMANVTTDPKYMIIAIMDEDMIYQKWMIKELQQKNVCMFYRFKGRTQQVCK